MSSYHHVYFLESPSISHHEEVEALIQSSGTLETTTTIKSHHNHKHNYKYQPQPLRNETCTYISEYDEEEKNEKSRYKGTKYNPRGTKIKQQQQYQVVNNHNSTRYHDDHLDLYCQRNPSPWESSSSQSHNYSFIDGTMYPPVSERSGRGGVKSEATGSAGGVGGSVGLVWSSRILVCRSRFWKFLVVVVVVLMMAQFSLNILFYRNYDSLFYVNITSVKSLSAFDSRVRWSSSKSPWVNATSGKSITIAPLHRPSTVSSTALTGGNKKTSGSNSVGEKHRLIVNSTVGSTNSNAKNIPSKLPNSTGETQDAKFIRVPEVNESSISSGRGGQENKRVLLSKEKPLCPPVPPRLVGSVKIYRTVPSLEEQERSHPELEPGGRFRPAECRARHRVAIIIPYRDRVEHLSMFTFHIHAILQRQQVDYAIYVVEQAGSGKFNRAMLMNVGALEALKQYPYDCFIFHDVDLLPEDDRNLYTCPEQPRHMSIAIDSMGYKLPYNDIFGGVSAMTVDQFRTVNGFSNKFWGWGGEDDDMSNRIKFHGFFISRYPANIGRYTMLSHKKDEPNPRRYQYLYDGKKRFKYDGFNSAKYRALDVQFRRLYTWVYVDLYPS